MIKFFRKIKCKLGFHELLCSKNHIYYIPNYQYFKADYFTCKYCKYDKIGYLTRSDINKFYKYIRKQKLEKLNEI